MHRDLGILIWQKARGNDINKQQTYHKITVKCTIGHNRMTRQPSCLQCKQADRDCVSRSRLSVSALLVCSMLLCGRLLVLHYLSAPQLQGVRHCDVCFMCQIWALNLNPSIFSNSSQMGLGRGSNCIPAGYFLLLTRQCLWCFILCDIKHCASTGTTRLCH